MPPWTFPITQSRTFSCLSTALGDSLVPPRDDLAGADLRLRRNLVLACEPCNGAKGDRPEGGGVSLTAEARRVLAGLS